MVVVQHPAQSLPSPDRSTMRRRTSLGSNEAFAEPWVIPFLMIMCNELPDRLPQPSLSEKDQSIQTRFLDVRTKRSARAFKLGERGGSFTDCIPSSEISWNFAVNSRSRSWTRYPLPKEETIHGVTDISGYVPHPSLVGFAPRLQRSLPVGLTTR